MYDRGAPECVSTTPTRASCPCLRGPSLTGAHADLGGGSWQSGPNKDLKWRIICQGVERLCADKGLDPDDVCLWADCKRATAAQTLAAPPLGRR